MPKISAVVPVYNVEEYLPRCIESALAQTLKDIEIICVDDGSTDGCPAMLDEYAAKDKRVKVIHQPNGGYGKAMNAGLKAATGEYFAVLESDDFIVPDAYEILYKNAKEYDADVVRADYYDYVTIKGEPVLYHKQITTRLSWYYRLICPNDEQEVFKFVMHNWTGIHKMEFLRKNNILYNETPGASYQDNGFYFQVFTQTDRLLYIPRACYCYRIDNPTSSIKDPKKVYTMTEEYSFIREFLSKHPEFEEKVMPAYYSRLFRVYYQTFKRIDESVQKEYADFMRETFLEVVKTHQLQTGLLTEKERRVLLTLLQSSDLFILRATPLRNASGFARFKKRYTIRKGVEGSVGARQVLKRMVVGGKKDDN